MDLVISGSMTTLLGPSGSYGKICNDINRVWRLEMVMVNDRDFVLIVHYASLYSHLLPAVNRAKFLIALSNILECSPLEFNFCKDVNRRVMGSMNDMKRMMNVWSNRYDHTNVAEMEKIINRTPFSYINMESPGKRWSRLTRR